MELQIGDSAKVYGYTSENYYYDGEECIVKSVDEDLVVVECECSSSLVHRKQCEFVSRPKAKFECIAEEFNQEDRVMDVFIQDLTCCIGKKVKITIEVI